MSLIEMKQRHLESQLPSLTEPQGWVGGTLLPLSHPGLWRLAPILVQTFFFALLEKLDP